MSTRHVAVFALGALAAVSAFACGRAPGRADSATSTVGGDSSRARGSIGADSSSTAPAPVGATPPTRLPASSAKPAGHSVLPAGGPVQAAAGADTLRGVVAVVGSAVDEHVVVRPNGSGPAVNVLGPQAPALGRLSGAEVWIAGTPAPMRGFNVTRFLVRSVDGVAAIDGTLARRGAGYVIVTTASGAERSVAKPPAALITHVGARVWITGSLDTGALAFGVISER